MAEALTADDLDFDDIPVTWAQSKVDDDLQFFSSIDNPTRTWLNTLNHVWSLCKYKNFKKFRKFILIIDIINFHAHFLL